MLPHAFTNHRHKCNQFVVKSTYAFIHTISIHHVHLQKQYSCKGLSIRRYLSLIEACFATSYVTATFHPTIGQCAHQSLNRTTTPEMGMIPTRNKGTLADSHIAKDTPKLIQDNIVGFIRLQTNKPIYYWVYQDNHPSQLTYGFNMLLSQAN